LRLGYPDKKPLGFVIPQAAIVLFLLYQRQINFLKTWWVPMGISIYLIIALPWYIYIYNHYGPLFIQEYFIMTTGAGCWWRNIAAMTIGFFIR